MSTTQLKTSVVMATFNGARHVKEQLDSLLRQSVLPDEIIIADDASTDNTTNILRRFKSTSTIPVTILERTATLGYARNFSDASLSATNDIILFCDQDDYWEEDKIEVIIGWFARNQDKELVVHDIKICDEYLEVIMESYFDHLTMNHARHTFIKGCATAVRKNLVERCFPITSSSRWKHDSFLHAVANLHSGSGYLDKTLIRHRLHKSQTSGFIIQNKSLRGRLLAILDGMAVAASPPISRSIYMIPKPITKRKVRELLETDKSITYTPRIEVLILWMRYRETRLLRTYKKSRMKLIISLLVTYFSGGYKDIGGGARCTVDVIRAVRSYRISGATYD